MDNRNLQFGVGVLVFSTMLIAFLLVVYFGEVFGQGSYRIHVQLPEAPGVAEGTPVRKHGILIGRVANVAFDNEEVTVTVSIKRQFELTTNEICRIGTGNLFGDAVLEFVSRKDQIPGPDVLQHGDFLRGEVAEDPLSMLMDLQKVVINLEDDVAKALTSVGTAGHEVGALAKNINTLLGENKSQIPELLNSASDTLKNINDASQMFRDVISNPELQEGLRNTMQQVPEVLSQLGDTLGGLERLTAAAADNLENMKVLTGSLAEQGPAIIEGIGDDLQLLDAVLRELAQVGQNINQGEGTVGKLLSDPELYDRLTRTVANIEHLTQRLRPVVEDVRVFSDKIARDPRQLGLRGAFDGRQSGLKRSPRQPWTRPGELPSR